MFQPIIIMLPTQNEQINHTYVNNVYDVLRLGVYAQWWGM